MSVALPAWRDHLAIDRHALYLAGLLVAVQAGALGLALPAVRAGYDPALPLNAGESAGGQAAAGIAWAGLEAVFAAVLLGLLALWSRIPEWIRETVTVLAVMLIPFGMGVALRPSTALYLGAFATAFTVIYKTTDNFNLYWLLNNLLAVLLATVLAVVVGVTFGVAGLAVALLGLTAYDHFFADKKDWMFSLAMPMVRNRIPVLVIIPSGWWFDWDYFNTDRDDADLDVTGIGTADLALPAGFGVAAATDTVLGGGAIVMAALLVGLVVAALRLRHKMLTTGSGAGLPALTAAVLGAYAVAMPLDLLLTTL